MRKTRKVLIAIWGVVFSAAIILGSMPLKASAKELIPVIQFSGAPKTDYFIGERIEFNINAANYGGKVEYRVVLWNDSTKSYSDLWNVSNGYPGRYYTKWQPTGNTNFTLGWPINEPGSYRITVYAKRVGIKSEKAAMKGMNCDSFKNSVAFVVKPRSTTMNEEGKTYGSKDEGKLEVLVGDTKITAKNISLINAKIEGDLEITGDNAIITNVKVLGKITINVGKDGVSTLEKVDAKTIEILSAGKNSIHIKSVKADNMDVNCSNPVRIEADGDTEILSTTANGYIIFDRKNGTFGEVKIIKGLNGESVVEFIGDIKDKVFVNTKATIKVVGNSSMETLVLNTEIASDLVKIEGNFKTVEIIRPGKLDVKGNSKVAKLVARSFADINVATTSLVSMIEKGNNNVDVKIEGTIGNTSYSSMGGGGGSFTGGGTVTPPVIPPVTPPVNSVKDINVKAVRVIDSTKIIVEMDKVNGVAFTFNSNVLPVEKITTYDGFEYVLSVPEMVDKQNNTLIITCAGYNSYTKNDIVYNKPLMEIKSCKTLLEIMVYEKENIVDLAALKASGKLPTKLVLEYGEDTIEVPITDWKGNYDGTRLNATVLTPVWSMPEGYQDEDYPIKPEQSVWVASKESILNELEKTKRAIQEIDFSCIAISGSVREKEQIKAVKAMINKLYNVSNFNVGYVKANTEIEVTKNTPSFDLKISINEISITTSIVTAIFNEASPNICFKFNSKKGIIGGITSEINNLSELVIPSVLDGVIVTAIESEGFKGCSKIISVSLPQSLYYLFKNAFLNCEKLERINIPMNLQDFEANDIMECPNLKSINVDPQNRYYSSVDGVVFDKWKLTVIKYPEGKEGIYDIPSGVRAVGRYAFFNCKSLTEITFPSSLEEIREEAFGNCENITNIHYPKLLRDVDFSAFDACSGLLNFSVNPENQYFSSINGILTSKSRKQIILYPKGRKDLNLFPEGIESIGKYAYCQCDKLVNIIIPSTVSFVDKFAFCFDQNLKSLDIPSYVTIDEGAFLYCFDLDTITIGEGVVIEDYAIIDPLRTYLFMVAYYKNGPGTYNYNYESDIWEKTSCSIKGFNPINLIQTGTISENSIQYKTSEQVINNLPRIIDVVLEDDSIAKIPITWTDTDKYNPKVPGDYTFTATWGTMPSMVDNRHNANPPITKVTVANSNIELLGIEIFPQSISLFEGGSNYSLILNVTPEDATSKNFIWSSSNENVVEVNDGILRPRQSGKATITVTSVVNKNITAKCEVGVFRKTDMVSIGMFLNDIEKIDFSNIPIIGKDNEVEQIGAINALIKNIIGTLNINIIKKKGTSNFYINIFGNGQSYTTCINATFVEASERIFFEFDKLQGIIGVNLSEKEKITDLVIPFAIDGVKVIGIKECGFSNCINMNSVQIPLGIVMMDSSVFNNCVSLSNINVNCNNPRYKSIEGVLFDRSGSSLIICPSGKSGVYKIPEGTEKLEEHAFYNCGKLLGVDIPKSVQNINFEWSMYCNELLNINVVSENPNFSSVEGVLFDKNGNKLLSFPQGRSGTYKAPETTDCFNWKAFISCTKLTSIEIPRFVSNIFKNSISLCPKLMSINVVSENMHFSSVNGVLLNKVGNLLIKFPEGLSDSSLIPNNVRTIGVEAFKYCAKLSSITLPDSIVIIENNAFAFCDNLTTILLGKNVETINSSSFADCQKLYSITVDKENAIFCSINGVLFDNEGTRIRFFPSGRAGEYIIPEGVTSIDSGAFYMSTGLTSIIIPWSTKLIKSYSLSGCSNLTKLSIPDDCVFEYFSLVDCNNISSITIGKNVTINGAILNETFLQAYNLGGAGTYILDNGTWKKS